MNKIVNKFLFAGDKFMPEMHLRQSGFTYSVCGLFTKRQRIQKFKETGDLKHIYQKEIDKVCFQWHGLWRFWDLIRRASENILHDKAFNIAKHLKYDGYQRGLLQWSINFLIKKLLLCIHSQRH